MGVLCEHADRHPVVTEAHIVDEPVAWHVGERGGGVLPSSWDVGAVSRDERKPWTGKRFDQATIAKAVAPRQSRTAWE